MHKHTLSQNTINYHVVQGLTGPLGPLEGFWPKLRPCGPFEGVWAILVVLFVPSFEFEMKKNATITSI